MIYRANRSGNGQRGILLAVVPYVIYGRLKTGKEDLAKSRLSSKSKFGSHKKLRGGMDLIKWILQRNCSILVKLSAS